MEHIAVLARAAAELDAGNPMALAAEVQWEAEMEAAAELAALVGEEEEDDDDDEPPPPASAAEEAAAEEAAAAAELRAARDEARAELKESRATPLEKEEAARLNALKLYHPFATDEELQVLAQQQRSKPLSARSPYGF